MEAASLNIKDTAFNVQSSARQLEMEAKKRQCRLYFIMGIIVVSILLYIIIPLATS